MKEETLYRFVKASEGLPEENNPGSLYEKVKRHVNTKVVYEESKVRGYDKDTMYYEGINDDLYIPLSQIEWLEEAPASPLPLASPDLEFAKWLEENTEVIYEPKITLYRYCSPDDGWGNYILDDIYAVYKEKGPHPELPAVSTVEKGELYEIRLTLYRLLRHFDKLQLTPEQKRCSEQGHAILKKYFKATDALRQTQDDATT